MLENYLIAESKLVISKLSFWSWDTPWLSLGRLSFCIYPGSPCMSYVNY